MEIIAVILPYVHIAFSAILITLVLVQFSDADLGGSFGGGNDGASRRTRRGFERTLFQATIIVAVLFSASVLVGLIIR